MNKSSFHILRVGMAITFLWIGILILKDPQAWTGFVQPWVTNLLGLPLKEVMIGTAIFDIVIGILLLVDYLTGPAALLGSLHLISVLTVSGITAITVRDIGLLAGTLALFLSSSDFFSRFFKKRQQ